jgi:hypothetical protein
MVVVWQQPMTGKVHKRQTCGVLRRTRYNAVRREVTEAELAALPKCGRCFKQATASQ